MKVGEQGEPTQVVQEWKQGYRKPLRAQRGACAPLIPENNALYIAQRMSPSLKFYRCP